MRMAGHLGNGQRIGPDLVPFLQQESVRFKEGPDLDGDPAQDVLQNRDQHAQPVLAEDGTPRNLRDVFVFRHRDGQPVQPVHVQHHVNVGTSVADINYAVVTDGKLRAQLLQNGYLAVARGNALNGLNLAAGWVVTEARSINVVRRDNSFQCRLDHFLGSR